MLFVNIRCKKTYNDILNDINITNLIVDIKLYLSRDVSLYVLYKHNFQL